MTGIIIGNIIRAIPVLLILYVAASIAGFPFFEVNFIVYSVIVFFMGILYGIMMSYQFPSQEFTQMITEEEKDMEKQEDK